MLLTLRALLTLTGLANLGWGLFALALPDRAAELLEFTLASSEARGEIRATYGGLIAGLGLAQLVALRRDDGSSWLAALALAFAGLALGRLASLPLDGFSSYTAAVGALEVGLAALLAVGARALGAESSNANRPVPRAQSEPS